MPSAHVVKQITINRTPRVMQLEGLFDLQAETALKETWDVDFQLPDNWQIGAIVGASGCGKSTIAKEVFGDNLISGYSWLENHSIIDSFPKNVGIKDITAALSSVGFSSPKSWLKPFNVLSNGEQFRVTVARALTEQTELIVIDEFTSVVDRTVAQIGSAAVSKAIRRTSKQFIAVSCHFDILDWLEPDWVYLPAENRFYAGRSHHQRPTIKLTVQRCDTDAWRIFQKHHYLDRSLNKSAKCFVALWGGRPVAFCAWLHFPHATAKNIKKEHRVVVLPDFQGVGIGNRFTDFMASCLKALGYRATTTTSHPAKIASLNRSPKWMCSRKPGLVQKLGASGIHSFKPAPNRFTASFEYVGESMNRRDAENLWGLSTLREGNNGA